MQERGTDTIGLLAVEREIAASGWWLKFAPPIETVFRVETAQTRFKNMVVTSFIAVVLYDLFLINDWVCLHDRFREMVFARLFIFTPATLGLIAISYRIRSILTTEWLTVVGGALAVVLPTAVMIFSHSTHKLSYQFGSALVMMFATVIQRLRFRPAAVALAVMLVEQFATTRCSDGFDLETLVAIASFYGTAALLQLSAVYFFEKGDRNAFLLALRGRLLHDQLVLNARTDALTGLYNRRYLAETTADLWTHPEPRCISAILIDLDQFKLFNDSRGHLEGDECLRVVAACLLDVVALGEGSTFRFGGEEMLVLLPDIEPRAARRTAEDIRTAIAKAAIPHPALGEDAVVTASFGIAGVVAPDSSAADLIAAADTTLYAAKRAGRNRIWPPTGPEQEPALERKSA